MVLRRSFSPLLASGAIVALLAAIAVVGASPPAHGATINNVDSEAAFRAALAHSSIQDSGDHLIVITEDIVFSDPGGDGDPTYSGEGNITIRGLSNPTMSMSNSISTPIRFLHFDPNIGASITLDNLTIQNFGDRDGALAKNGAALNATVQTTHVTILDSTFTGNSGPDTFAGGAIWASGPDIDVVDSAFMWNSGGSGAAIWSNAYIEVTGSTFIGNTTHFPTAGGAINTNSVAITDSTFADNEAESVGGAVDALWADVRGSHFEDNHAGIGGGAIHIRHVDGELNIASSTFVGNSSGDVAGAVSSLGPMTAYRTAFRDNTSSGSGGAVSGNSSIEIYSSEFSGNTAGVSAGALRGQPVDGGDSSTISVWNSTFSGNSAGITSGGIFSDGQDVEVRFSTFLSNEANLSIPESAATSGAHIVVAGAILRASTSVFADPITAELNCEVFGIDSGSTSQGYNWLDADTCANVGSDPDDIIGTDPMLGPLASNGGPTLSHLPLAGSPLVDQIPVVQCSDTTSDQRGFLRPFQDLCDIGAIERTMEFPDVTSTHPFHEEIRWLAGRQITGGYSDGNFRPAIPVSRQAMAAFLYRFEGEPAFTAPATPSFSDVPASHPFYTEIEWLASTEITTGYTDGTYRPATAVSRQAMAAFMYRLLESPDFTPASQSFPDVSTAHPFYTEIEWLADTGVTTGYSDGTFRPSISVSRQAMAAFLYRLDAL